MRSPMRCFLFGNVLGVQQSALLLTLVASVIALLVVWLAYRPLLLYAFDPQQLKTVMLISVGVGVGVSSAVSASARYSQQGYL